MLLITVSVGHKYEFIIYPNNSENLICNFDESYDVMCGLDVLNFYISQQNREQRGE